MWVCASEPEEGEVGCPDDDYKLENVIPGVSFNRRFLYRPNSLWYRGTLRILNDTRLRGVLDERTAMRVEPEPPETPAQRFGREWEDEEGNMLRPMRILSADALATMGASLAGTTTTNVYGESAAGVESGGRTGLVAILVGLLFLWGFSARKADHEQVQP